ncbi:agmatinase [Candidatus Aerophobetes bacterium]|nr:agmatinase [Candidatus Aerophobetes bacterium]
MSHLQDKLYILNFADIPSHLSDVEKSAIRVIPLPYEATTTYRGGTKDAPLAVIQASKNLELFDDELSIEPCQSGISTFLPHKFSSAGPEVALKELYEYVKDLLSVDKFYIFIGGEHSITSAITRAFHEKFSSLSVLQLDAHADLRDTYQSSPYSHACVMRRVAEFVPFVQLGVRSMSREESDFIKKNNIACESSDEIFRSERWMELIDKKLSRFVYLTVDVDVMDPSIVPSVGTPEPGGLSWQKILEIIRYVARCKKIVGVDVVELSPIPGMIAPDFLVAKLIYKIIGYIIFYGK